MNASDALNYFQTPLEKCDARRDFANGNYLLEHAARSLDATLRLRVLERCFAASLVADGVDVRRGGDGEGGQLAPHDPMSYLLEISKQFPMFAGKYDAIEAQRVVESLDTVYCVETTPIASYRTLLLHGQLLEARQQFEQAFKLYEYARERNANNSTLVVRQVCVLRQMKKLVQCVSLLNSYLAVYCTDIEAWKELCFLNIESGEIAKAKFCAEEMLLLAPQDGNVVLLNAEIHYSLAMSLSGHKRTDTLELARQYYVMALELLPPNNSRALFGLHLCCAKLSDVTTTTTTASKSSSSSSSSTSVNDASSTVLMRRWSANTLLTQTQGTKNHVILTDILNAK